jgi:hypothetical protein
MMDLFLIEHRRMLLLSDGRTPTFESGNVKGLTEPNNPVAVFSTDTLWFERTNRKRL